MTRPVESVSVWPKIGLRHEDTFGVMPQRPVPEIRDDHLGFVKPVVDALIVLDSAAPLLHAGEGMVIRMRHDSLPQKV
jgi:hypothetical protein